MQVKITEQQKLMAAFKKEHSEAVVGNIKVGSVLGGMHGMLGMIYQTSKLHPTMGINYRGHDLHTIIKRAQKAPGGEQPLPEAILWLLLSGEFPTKEEMEELQQELFERGKLKP